MSLQFTFPLNDAEYVLRLIRELENQCVTNNLSEVSIDSYLVLELANVTRAYVYAMRSTFVDSESL